MQSKLQLLTGTTLRAGAIAAAAALVWGLWRAGIAWFNGGDGLNWLQGFHWGAVPVCIVIAAACAIAVSRDYEPVPLLLFIGLASGLCFAAFAAGRSELFEMFTASTGAAPLIRLVVYSVAISISLTWLASRLLAPLHWWTALLLAGALFLAVPLGLLMVTLFPGGRHADVFNAIRLGYPAFWSTLLLPGALWLGVKKRRRLAVLDERANWIRS